MGEERGGQLGAAEVDGENVMVRQTTSGEGAWIQYTGGVTMSAPPDRAITVTFSG